MKKIAIFGLVAVMGTSMAFASSLAVPWYTDNSPACNGVPPTQNVTSIIALKNNTDQEVTCTIAYYTDNGVELIPTPNTFIIPAFAAVQFRPVEVDPSGATTQKLDGTPVTACNFGQESIYGVSIPDRPVTTAQHPDADGKKNGSITITWTGASTDIQGQVTTVQTFAANAQGNRLNNNVPLVISYAYLLPPGN